MPQIIQENRKPSFSEKIGLNNIMSNLGQGTAHGLIGSREEHKQKLAETEQRKAIQSYAEQMGIGDISKFPLELQKVIISEKLKGEHPKSPLGGLTGQPIPQEVSQAMNEIVENFPNAGADQLKMMMDKIGVPPAYSNQYVENRRRQDERMQASKDKRLESGQKRAEKVLDKADALGQEIPLLESSIYAMEDAIMNGDQSFWSLDNLAEMTGLELFRTAKGGQFKTAAKNYFINDLKASGARPNQFIEKQLADALAKVGRSQEANQTVIESFKFSNDLKKRWHETVRDLEKRYEEEQGHLPGSFSRIVEETMEPYVKERQKRYEDKLKEIAVQEKKNANSKTTKKEKSTGPIRMLTPGGEEIFVPDNELEEALSLGAMRA